MHLFTLASYYPDDSGRLRRTKRTFAALHGIMLDDIGTKVNHDRVSLPLSWLIETSQRNCQGGLILAEPLADAAAADRIMDANYCVC